MIRNQNFEGKENASKFNYRYKRQLKNDKGKKWKKNRLAQSCCLGKRKTLKIRNQRNKRRIAIDGNDT
jgi:hypothetical protein